MADEQIAPVIADIKEALKEVDEADIEKELRRYLKYGIVASEAKKAIIRKFGGGRQPIASMGERKLCELQGSEMSVDIVVKCLSSTERMQATVNGDKPFISGLLADDTMIRQFVSWEGHLLEKGKVYGISSASARTYRGEVEINLGSYSKVEELSDHPLKDLDLSKLPRFGTLVELKLKDLRSGIGNISVKAKVLSVEQRTIESDKGKKRIFDGILADDTKRVRFTSWHDFKLEPGNVVAIKGAYIKEWRGIPQLNFDERAEVSKLKDLDFDVMNAPRLLAEDLVQTGASDVEVSGTIIEIKEGSGLIMRCPLCKRMLSAGSCSVHGPQEGVPDLRAKVVLDDGTGALFAVLNTEITEQILGMGVTECNDKFCEEEGRVVEFLVQKLLGRDFIMRGNVIKDEFGPTVLPVSVQQEEGATIAEAEEMLKDLEVV